MIEIFNIKKLDADDFSDMSAVLKNASPDWDELILKDCFHPEYQHWGIFFQDTLLGFVIIRVIPDAWEVIQIVIDPLYQRQGLASQLMRFVIDEAKKNKIKKCQLEVRASNHPAILLYQQLHFHEVGIRKKYYANGDDALLLDCRL